MLTKTIRAGLFAAAAMMATAAVAQAEITGAGSTFAAPIFTKWGEQSAAAGGEKLNYQAVGSGAGVTQIINRTVDFGASDAAVPPDRLTSQNLLQFPAVIGGVVVAVNIPGVDGNAMKLTGSVLAEIYMGKIKMWSDAKIKALNPGVKLPIIPIAPAYRADSSGTTNIFTTYLASTNPAFGTTVGAGNSVAWKAGVGAPGNAGVAGAVRNTRGGLGYVEYAYATENGMQTPLIQNKSGAFVKPSTAAFAAAAATADWAHAPNMAASLLNTAGAPNWPIVGATYVLLPKNPSNAAQSKKVMAFFDWAFKNGQPAIDQLHYIALPKAVQDLVRTKWKDVKFGGKSVYGS
jgi:phosphate transport system substrate-binding protein